MSLKIHTPPFGFPSHVLYYWKTTASRLTRQQWSFSISSPLLSISSLTLIARAQPTFKAKHVTIAMTSVAETSTARRLLVSACSNLRAFRVLAKFHLRHAIWIITLCADVIVSPRSMAVCDLLWRVVSEVTRLHLIPIDYTYDNECLAHTAGVSVANTGECSSNNRDVSCTVGDNTCKGNEYCKGVEGACGGDGRCTPMPTACTMDYTPGEW